MISDLFLFGLFYSAFIDYVPFTVALKFQVVVLLIESTPWLNDELVIKRSIIDNSCLRRVLEFLLRRELLMLISKGRTEILLALLN